MKFIIVFLYFLTSSAFLYAEEVKLMPEVVKLFQDAPKLAQNLRSFDTLEMEVTTERFVDGKWKLETSSKIAVDFKRDRIRIKEVKENDKPFRFRSYRERVADFQSGKEATLYADFDEAETNIFFPKKLNDATIHKGRALGTSISAASGFLWSHFFIFFDSYVYPCRHITLLEFIQDPGYQNTGKVKIERRDPNTTLVGVGYRQFSVDLSKGMPFKYVDIFDGEGEESGTKVEDCTLEVTEFTLKDGRLFPTAILCKERDAAPYRQKINPKTLKIDQPLSPSDFAVKIYPGTRVLDKIENREYIAGQEMSSADIKELEKQIVNLVGEVQKHREKSKNEAKAKKEQQGKEKQ